ncbi:MAG TPA: NADH-quinone oxidoreductase subunit N [Bryobacterales bacterium]|jgi:NADH-quinone oxidoreductase subunit N|nr:NADH-quinone oxidoreductase subunit N [Bryobacterales bacterium]
MSGADFLALLPLILIAATSIVVMLAIAVARNHTLIAGLTVVGLTGAFVSVWLVAPVAPRQVTPLLVIDRYALFYTALLAAAAIAVAALSHAYLHGRGIPAEELYLLLLLATLGCVVLVASSHFVSFFLGLEILSVSLYAMIAYLREWERPLEAGIKYLILAAASAAFLLFGMALIYADTGTMDFARIADIAAGRANLPLLLPGTALLVTGVGFKLALVPFHLWTPDVYEGAPAPVTAFVATASKGAMFALLVRYFYRSGSQHPGIAAVFSIIALASMFAGNLLALLQANVKRILAYSSIAHLGYLLVAFLAGGPLGLEAISFYLVAYFITTLGAFGVVAALSDRGRDADDLEDYRGLFWRRPGTAVVFTAMLLSLAGIPLTAGFIGKFYVVAAGASGAKWALVLSLVVASAIGLYYYLRIVVMMYRRPPEGAAVRALAPASGFVLAMLTALLLWFGVYPTPLLNVIRAAVTMPQ